MNRHLLLAMLMTGAALSGDDTHLLPPTSLGRRPRCGSAHPQIPNMRCQRPHGHDGEHALSDDNGKSAAGVRWIGSASIEEEPLEVRRWTAAADAEIRGTKVKLRDGILARMPNPDDALLDEAAAKLIEEARAAERVREAERRAWAVRRAEEARREEEHRRRLWEADEPKRQEARRKAEEQARKRAMAKHKSEQEARRAKRAAKLAQRARKAAESLAHDALKTLESKLTSELERVFDSPQSLPVAERVMTFGPEFKYLTTLRISDDPTCHRCEGAERFEGHICDGCGSVADSDGGTFPPRDAVEPLAGMPRFRCRLTGRIEVDGSRPGGVIAQFVLLGSWHEVPLSADRFDGEPCETMDDLERLVLRDLDEIEGARPDGVVHLRPLLTPPATSGEGP